MVCLKNFGFIYLYNIFVYLRERDYEIPEAHNFHNSYFNFSFLNEFRVQITSVYTYTFSRQAELHTKFTSDKNYKICIVIQI